jgi:hypothetical protein
MVIVVFTYTSSLFSSGLFSVSVQFVVAMPFNTQIMVFTNTVATVKDLLLYSWKTYPKPLLINL